MDTPASLLERLQRPAAHEAWSRFVRLYAPLLHCWARRLGLTGDTADDLVQEVFVHLLDKLPSFRYDADKRFRGWLWAVMRNKCREYHRRHDPPCAPLAAVEPAVNGEAEEIDEAEYRVYLLNRIQQLMQAELPATTWRAYWEHVACGKPATEVATELGITTGAVYVAKCRVLRRLREELAGLLD